MLLHGTPSLSTVPEEVLPPFPTHPDDALHPLPWLTLSASVFGTTNGPPSRSHLEMDLNRWSYNLGADPSRLPRKFPLGPLAVSFLFCSSGDPCFGFCHWWLALPATEHNSYQIACALCVPLSSMSVVRPPHSVYWCFVLFMAVSSSLWASIYSQIDRCYEKSCLKCLGTNLFSL